MKDLAFLVDLFGHMNSLNLQLQGKGKSVTSLWTAVKAFKLKLDVFQQDLNGEMIHFPTVREFINSSEIDLDQRKYEIFLNKMKAEYLERFHQFQEIDKILMLIKQPQHAAPNGPWSDQVKFISPEAELATLQLEMCNLHGNDEEVNNPEEFWTAPSTREKYPTLTPMALTVLTFFGSTYLCESGFSNMNYIKSKFRSQLTQSHLHDLLRLGTTSMETTVDKIMSTKNKFNFSH